jgi:IS30 family transposase
MEQRYTQLQPEEPMTLASLNQQGWSIRAIAKLQGRSPSTISGGLWRNSALGSASGPAQSLCAQRRVQARRLPKLHPNGTL